MCSHKTPTHVGLEQRVLAHLKRLKDRDNRPLVIGFSGGGDSLCLAAVLKRVGSRVGLPVILAHVNHKLRPESSAEAGHATDLANSLGLPFVSVEAPADLYEHSAGIGIEEAARRMRYVALSSIAHEHGTDLIALAHHQDDQAETVILHLLRGAGLDGAAAMSDLSTLRVPWWPTTDQISEIRVWRPFLNESQSTLRPYLASLGLVPIDDASNADPRFTRNRVRHEVLPLLRSINPDASGSLARFARIAAEEDLALDHIAEASLRQVEEPDGTIATARLAAQPTAIQRRVIRRWLFQQGFPAELSFDRVEAVLRLVARGRGGATIELGSDWFVTAERGILHASEARERRSEPGDDSARLARKPEDS